MSKILVIEDEEQIREEIVGWLQFEGYEVAGATNGRQGLEAIRRDIPDLILCDNLMPEMDGRTLLVELHTNPDFNHIPFIFLTAAADHDSIRKGMELGADDYITKPFTHTELLRAIQSRLEKRTVQENRDVSRREKIEAALRLSEVRYSALVHNFPNGCVLLFDQDLRYIVADGELFSSGVLNSERFVNRTIYEVHSSQTIATLEPCYQAALGGIKNSFEFLIPQLNQVYLVYTIPVRDEKGAVIAGMVMTQDITPRKQAEERLNLALASGNQGWYDTNLDTGEIITNQEYIKMLGYELEPPFKTTEQWFESVHPEDRAHLIQVYQGYVEGNLPDFRVEVRQQTANNSWKWVLIHGKIVKSNFQGTPLRMLGTLTDITPLKEAEDKLVIMRNLYAALSKTNEAIVRMPDKKALYEEICRVAVEYGGLKLAWIGEPDESQEIIAPVTSFGDGPGYLDKLSISTRGDLPEGRGPTGVAYRENRHYICNDFYNDPITLPWRNKIRSYNFRSSAALPLKKAGRVIGVLTLYSDVVGFFDEDIITLLNEMALDISLALDNFAHEEERIKAREALQLSEEHFRVTFEQAAVGIAHLSLTGQFLKVNRRLCEILGYSQNEFYQLHFNDLVYPSDPDGSQELSQSLLAGEVESYIEEKRYLTRAGTPLWVNLTTSVVRNLKGQPEYLMVVVMDISDRKKTEEELYKSQEQFRQAQKMEAVGRLAGGVAHDFNNMLTAILSYCDLIESRLEPGSPLYEDFEEIQKAAERATHLTRHLLALSRTQVLNLVQVNLSKVVKDTNKMLQRLIGEDIKIITRLDETIGKVLMDETQVTQIILNLVVNARDAMPNGGQLTMETFEMNITSEEVGHNPELKAGKYVGLAVTDNGCGMDQEILNHIFEPFFTTKAEGKGTGLGLSTVYGIVTQSKGFIEVKSHPGQGTCFRVYFPLFEGEHIVVDRHYSPSKSLQGGSAATIMLVEDDDSVRKVTSLLLQRRGYKVMEAVNAEIALELLQTYPGSIELMLTDIILPGMNGRELSKQALIKRPDLKILITSGYSDHAVMYEEINSLNLNFLQKPYSPGVLYTRVQEILEAALKPSFIDIS